MFLYIFLTLVEKIYIAIENKVAKNYIWNISISINIKIITYNKNIKILLCMHNKIMYNLINLSN